MSKFTTLEETANKNNEEIHGGINMENVNVTVITTTTVSVSNTNRGGKDMNNTTTIASEKAYDKEAILSSKPKSMQYCESNVKEIMHLAKAGATKAEVAKWFDKTEATIYLWLKKYYVRKGNAKNIWKMLCENTKAAEAEAEDKIETEATVVAEAEAMIETETVADAEAKIETEAVAEVTEMQVEEFDVNAEKIDYILDSQLIQKYSGRMQWHEIIKKLHAEGKNFALHSESMLERLATGDFSETIRCFAKGVKEDKSIKAMRTHLYLNYAALKTNAIVITNSEKTFAYCNVVGAKVIFSDDYLAETSSEWAKRLTIPVTLNNNRRIIAELSKLCAFGEKTYGLENVQVSVLTSDGRVRNTPTGKLRIVKGDVVRITGVDGNYSITIDIEVTAEEEKDNCFERKYNKAPVSSVKNKKYIV